jgi:hypothetical protein
MAVVVTLDSVTTTDVTPTAAPHRISAIAGENNAAIRFTPTSAGGVIRMVLLMVGRTLASVIGHRQDVTNGYPHFVRGMVCGMPQSRCGTQSFSLSAPSGTQFTDNLRYATIPVTADGGRQVTMYACAEGEGWSSN